MSTPCRKSEDSNEKFAPTGIGAGRIDDVLIGKNIVAGSPDFGAGARLSSGCRLHLNDFSGLNSQVADIVLLETTNHCRLTAFNGDTVLDLGTDNRVIFR